MELEELSENLSIRLYQIIKYPNLNWKFGHILRRTDFKTKDQKYFTNLKSYAKMEEYDSKEQVFEKIELSKNIYIRRLVESDFFSIDFLKEIIVRNPSCFTDDDYILLTLLCKISDIINNPDIPWNYRQISYDPDLTFNNIKNNLDIPWNIEKLTEHNNLRLCDLKLLNIDIIDYRDFMTNENISFNFINFNLQYISFEHLSYNQFNYDRRLNLTNKIKKNYKIKKLKLIYKLANKYLINDLVNIAKKYYYG